MKKITCLQRKHFWFCRSWREAWTRREDIWASISTREESDILKPLWQKSGHEHYTGIKLMFSGINIFMWVIKLTNYLSLCSVPPICQFFDRQESSLMISRNIVLTPHLVKSSKESALNDETKFCYFFTLTTWRFWPLIYRRTPVVM